MWGSGHYGYRHFRPIEPFDMKWSVFINAAISQAEHGRISSNKVLLCFGRRFRHRGFGMAATQLWTDIVGSSGWRWPASSARTQLCRYVKEIVRRQLTSDAAERPRKVQAASPPSMFGGKVWVKPALNASGQKPMRLPQ